VEPPHEGEQAAAEPPHEGQQAPAEAAGHEEHPRAPFDFGQQQRRDDAPHAATVNG
jgi:hypothetical protein